MHEIAASFDSKATANPFNVQQYFKNYKNVGELTTAASSTVQVTIFLPICEAKQLLLLLLHLFFVKFQENVAPTSAHVDQIEFDHWNKSRATNQTTRMEWNGQVQDLSAALTSR